MGIGNITDPFTITEALNSVQIQPGHTLWLRGGTYTGAFVCALNGTSDNSITIKPYNNETVIIDGSLTVNGDDVIIQGLEILNSAWLTRVSAETGSNPSDIPVAGNGGSGLDIYGKRVTVKRCVIHDTRQGIGFWTPAVDATIEECVIFNNGWNAPDRTHGHQLYVQNATGTKQIKRCVFAGGYSDYSVHGFTTSGDIQGFNFEECIHINKQWLVGGGTPVDRLTLTRNILWDGILQLGFSSIQNESADLVNNILANTVGRITSGTWVDLVESGTDTTTGNRAIIYGRNVAIFNQANAASVSVNLGAMGLTNGVTYKLRNAQNYLNEWISFTYNGSAVNVPMSGWTVAVPIAAASALDVTTFPTFGVFVVTED